jgi:hypothetical protein
MPVAGGHGSAAHIDLKPSNIMMSFLPTMVRRRKENRENITRLTIVCEGI